MSLNRQPAGRPTVQRLHELFFVDAQNPAALRWRIKRPHRPAGSAAGYVRRDGYRLASVDGQRILAGRIVWALVHGRWPAHEIGHINGCRCDDRPSNLIDVPRSVHHLNSLHPRKGNRSGLPGAQVRPSGRFASKVNGHWIGVFPTADEASAAAWNFKREVGVLYRKK